MLLCDWIPLFSISCALVLQKSSDKLAFLTERPWILKRLEGSSTAVIGVGLTQQPKQPPMQATRRRTQVARDLQHSSIASGPGAATEETGGGANPSPRDGGEWREGEGREESEWDSAVGVGVRMGLGEGIRI